MDAVPVVIPPGQGHRLGNVEFLARTADTPRFTFGIIEIAPGRVLEAHVHADEDDAFYILEGEMTFILGDRGGGRASRDVRPRAARASSTAFATSRRSRCGCSTSTPRQASTGASAWPTEPVAAVSGRAAE